MPLEILENVPLASRHTLRARCDARWLVEVRSPDDLPAALALPQARGQVLVLGEGSNVLFADDFDGLVLCPRFTGIAEDGDGRVTVAAGENWHAFVRWSLAAGYCGLENLALIPGSVGAAPIQNIGAYGVELEHSVERVRVWDRQRGGFTWLDRDACGFAYRDSVFKRHPDRFVVQSVTFRLSRTPSLCLDYAGVRDALAEDGIERPTPTDVADAVERVRRRKLPDPAEIGNAGSFFKNPVVTVRKAADLRAEHPEIPVWPAEGGNKISAAWLLEHCGFKGLRDGDAGFAGVHALVLVNYGTASGRELLALADQARAAVAERFGVTLEPEPRIIQE